MEPGGNFAVGWTQDRYGKGAYQKAEPYVYLLNWCPHCGSKEHLKRDSEDVAIYAADGLRLVETQRLTADFCTRCGFGPP